MNESRSRIRFVQRSSPGAEKADPSPGSTPVPVLDRAALHGLVRHRHVEEDQRAGDGEIFLPQSVYRKIMEHLSSDTGRELGGLLVGAEIEPKEGRPTILIQDALPALHTRSHETRLTFTEESWVAFNRELDALEARGVKLQRVGWYHSHPYMGIFLSRWDLDVCREFRRPTQVALVIDPVEPKGGFFVQGTEGFRDHAPQGFWEVQDQTPHSVVRWKNVTATPGLPPGFLQNLQAPGASRPDVQPRPAAEVSAWKPEVLGDGRAATPVPGPVPQPPSPQPPSEPGARLWPLAAAAMLAVAVLAAAAGWGFGRGAWGEDSEALLRRHTADLASLSSQMKELNATVEKLISQEPGPPPAAFDPVEMPPVEEPVPPPPVQERPRPSSNTNEGSVSIRPSKKPARTRQQRPAVPAAQPAPVTGQPVAADSSPGTPQEATASAAQAPVQETPTPKPPEASQQPATTAEKPAGASPASTPAPDPPPTEGPPPPEEKDPPANQGEGGSQQGSQGEA